MVERPHMVEVHFQEKILLRLIDQRHISQDILLKMLLLLGLQINALFNLRMQLAFQIRFQSMLTHMELLRCQMKISLKKLHPTLILLLEVLGITLIYINRFIKRVQHMVILEENQRVMGHLLGKILT